MGVRLIPHVNAEDTKEIKRLSKRFDGCEILFWHRDGLRERILDVKETIEETKMRAHVIHIPNYHINREGEAGRKEVSELVDLISKIYALFKPKIINMHCLYKRVEEMKKNLMIVLESIPKDVVITIENMTRKKANIRDSESAKRFFEDLDYTNIGLCLDVCHVPLSGDILNSESKELISKMHTKFILEFISEVRDKLKHLHISDVKIVDGKVLKHQPIGEGIIRWCEIKEMLEGIGYNGFGTIEYLSEYRDKINETIENWENLSSTED